jgi:hypothetical protein
MPAPKTELIAGATWEQVYQIIALPDMRVGIAGSRGIGKTAGVFDVGKRIGKRSGCTFLTSGSSDGSPARLTSAIKAAS